MKKKFLNRSKVLATAVAALISSGVQANAVPTISADAVIDNNLQLQSNFILTPASTTQMNGQHAWHSSHSSHVSHSSHYSGS